jgi:hypothetical protein
MQAKHNIGDRVKYLDDYQFAKGKAINFGDVCVIKGVKWCDMGKNFENLSGYIYTIEKETETDILTLYAVWDDKLEACSC